MKVMFTAIKEEEGSRDWEFLNRELAHMRFVGQAGLAGIFGTRKYTADGQQILAAQLEEAGFETTLEGSYFVVWYHRVEGGVSALPGRVLAAAGVRYVPGYGLV